MFCLCKLSLFFRLPEIRVCDVFLIFNWVTDVMLCFQPIVLNDLELEEGKNNTGQDGISAATPCLDFISNGRDQNWGEKASVPSDDLTQAGFVWWR